MSGRLIGIIILASAVLAGGALYYLQIYAFYQQLDPQDVALKITRDGAPEAVNAREIQAIDSQSSPIRFRACFRLTDGAAESADMYEDAVPLNAPGWFDCFDAAQIGADLATGDAAALMGEQDVIWGIDRVIALYPDGRGFAWQQINPCGAAGFDGDPLPPSCSPPPGN